MSKGNNAREQIAQRLNQVQELISEVVELLGDGIRVPAKKPKRFTGKKTSSDLDFTMPMRPFVKRHVSGMNGAAKFTLLVAYLVKGEESKTAALSDVEGHWNKMTDKSLLGMKFNRLYSSEAKNNDWVHAPAKGAYQLRPSWKEIFE